MGSQPFGEFVKAYIERLILFLWPHFDFIFVLMIEIFYLLIRPFIFSFVLLPLESLNY